MKAMQYTEPGGVEVLSLTEVADPEPGPVDVVVDVAATSLNRLDVVQRNGWFQLPGFTYPHIAGMDIAGTVTAVGTDVTTVSIGDRVVVDPSLANIDPRSALADRALVDGAPGVIGGTVAGGYAERCLVPAANVYPVPDSVSFDHAATFPTTYATAAHALFAVGNLQAGETVLIHAAGSGLSSAAIQLAHHVGATVIATAGTDEKCEQARSIGIDHVCNNRTDDIAAWAREVTDGQGVNMVFDHVGPALFAPSLFSLAYRGRMVCVGNSSGDEAAIPSLGHLFHSGISILGSDAYSPAEFAETWDLFCSADFTVTIDSVYPLADAAAAHTQLESGNFFGKLLLHP